MDRRSAIGFCMAATMLIAAGGCCAHRPAGSQSSLRAAPPPKPPPEPWIKADAFCVLPLSGPKLPPTGGQLVESLQAAFAKALELKQPNVVTVVGGRYPAVQSMRVDLSGATAAADSKHAKINTGFDRTQSLAVQDFALVAEPFRSHDSKSSVNLLVTGQEVRFDLQKDKQGRTLLMLTDARAGRLHFDADVREMERGMLAAAKEKAGGLLRVRDLSLSFRAVGPRSLDLTIDVKTLFGLIPAGLRFTARVDVDDQMNATLWNVDAEGDEVLGPLIVHLIRPSLAKFNGKTRPMMTFPKDRVKLKNVQLTGGDRITLDAAFGR